MKDNFTIFLDIDGVLATDKCLTIKKKYWYDQFNCPFDADCVKLFNALLRTTNAEIVLSSSWRLFYSFKELDEIFKFNKVVASPLDCTDSIGDRNLEIEEYVRKNNVTHFVIFDDMELLCFPKRFVRTDIEKGITQKHIEKAIKIFDS